MHNHLTGPAIMPSNATMFGGNCAATVNDDITNDISSSISNSNSNSNTVNTIIDDVNDVNPNNNFNVNNNINNNVNNNNNDDDPVKVLLARVTLYFLFFVFVAPIACSLWTKLTRKKSLGETVAKLSEGDRFRYYNDLFSVKHGNQIELTADQIIVKINNNNTKTTTTTGKSSSCSADQKENDSSSSSSSSTLEMDIETGLDDDDDADAKTDHQVEHGEVFEEEEDSCVYLSIDSIVCSNNAADDDVNADVDVNANGSDNRNDDTRPSSSSINSNGINNDINNTDNMIRGECVICFENFEAGDTIVYNNININKSITNNNESTATIEPQQHHPDCPHVYHKSCMVAYLVKRTISKRGLHSEEGCPTCPTCRQPYCELIPISPQVVARSADTTATDDKDTDADVEGDSVSDNDTGSLYDFF